MISWFSKEDKDKEKRYNEANKLGIKSSTDQISYMNGHFNPLYFFKDCTIVFSTDVKPTNVSEAIAMSKSALYRANYLNLIKEAIFCTNRLFEGEYTPIEAYSITDRSNSKVGKKGKITKTSKYTLSLLGLHPDTAVDLASMLCLIFEQDTVVVEYGDEIWKEVKNNQVEIVGKNFLTWGDYKKYDTNQIETWRKKQEAHIA